MAISTLDCDSRHTVYTIGHSTRSIETFIDLLKGHSIDLVVDVRRWPASRHCPQFSREALAAALSERSIGYLWRGDLGGFRKPVPDSPNSAWRVAAFRAYADFMMTAKFDDIMKEMIRVARASSAALMCAEAVPWRCHRQLLADAFSVREIPVRHIMEKGCQPHALPAFAQLNGSQIIYRRID